MDFNYPHYPHFFELILAKKGVDIFDFIPHMRQLNAICYYRGLTRALVLSFATYPHYPQFPQWESKLVFTRDIGDVGLAFFYGYGKIHLPHINVPQVSMGFRYIDREY